MCSSMIDPLMRLVAIIASGKSQESPGAAPLLAAKGGCLLPQQVGQRNRAGARAQYPLFPSQQLLHQRHIPSPGSLQQLLFLPHPGHKFTTTGRWISNKSPINPCASEPRFSV